MKELTQAIHKKNDMLNKADSGGGNEYFYTETVTVKHRPEICFGIKDHPYYTTHTELRFNYDRYHKDIGAVSLEIENYLAQISHFTDSVELLTSKTKITEENQLIVTNSEKIKNSAEVSLSQTKAKLTSYLQGLNEIQRACIVASKAQIPGSEFLIETICDLGFDCNVLAKIAIDGNDISIFDFALNLGADLDGHLVDDKTLIQHAIMQGNQSIITRAIGSTKNFESSLMYAMTQDDLATIKTILSSYPGLASNLLFDDCTLLHYAIASNQINVAHYLINLHPKTLEINNSNGDSCFKIALRSGNDEIVSLVSSHVFLEQECAALVKSGDDLLVNRAIKLQLVKEDYLKTHEQDVESLILISDHVVVDDTESLGNLYSNHVDNLMI